MCQAHAFTGIEIMNENLYAAMDDDRANGHGVCPLDLVELYLRRFVAYPSEHALVAHVLWIAHCHLVECFDTTPRLAFMSPEKASGKTRALEITGLFVPHARMSINISAAALARIIAKGHEDGNIPTLLYDEIDNLFSKNEGRRQRSAWRLELRLPSWCDDHAMHQ